MALSAQSSVRCLGQVPMTDAMNTLHFCMGCHIDERANQKLPLCRPQNFVRAADDRREYRRLHHIVESYRDLELASSFLNYMLFDTRTLNELLPHSRSLSQKPLAVQALGLVILQSWLI